MRISRKAAAVATGPLAAALLVLPPASASAPKIMSGTIAAPNGGTLAGATVSVYATKDTESGSTETLIGRTTSDSAGAFAVTGGLGSAPHTLLEDGTVQLQVDVTSPTAQTIRYYNAAPPATTDADWTVSPVESASGAPHQRAR